MRNPGSAGLTADRLGDTEKWESDEKVSMNVTSGSNKDIHSNWHSRVPAQELR
jgi:hypothetical protein